ncbi:MAG: manganese efflux pump MntP family protein [Acholeplasmatales bacterium]|nr:manganese efflux pump MntP family protein [Acholeplasmatales bacterium]
MSVEIILEIILLGIALSMDAFAVSITDGLTYTDINKKKSFFIAGLFGLMQALMPLIGFFIVEGITLIVGESGGENAGKIMADIVSWIAFALLLFIGSKMLIEGIKDLKKTEEEKELKKFSFKEVIYFGFATSIDALGTGVALHSGLSNTSTIWLHVSIILFITFVISLIGLFLGHKIEKLLKGKYEITNIIGGTILIILAIWIILSHYFGL